VKFGIVIPLKAILLLQVLYPGAGISRIERDETKLSKLWLVPRSGHFHKGAICIKFTININRLSPDEAVSRNLDRKQTIIGMITPVDKVRSIWLVGKYYG
jgi:hypothetical protein